MEIQTRLRTQAQRRKASIVQAVKEETKCNLSILLKISNQNKSTYYFELQRRYPRIVYSGMTALYLLGLTDWIPDSIEFTIPKGCRVRRESIGNNAICHIENNVDLFELGYANIETMFGNRVACFSREKMAVEMIRKRGDYDSELFLKAVKTFLKGKDRDMGLLFERVRMRKIEEKVYRMLKAMDYED